MKSRLTRLVLAAGVAVALAPAAPAAHAMSCAPGEVEAVCNAVFGTWGAVCRYVPEGGKVDPHELACPQLG